MKTYTVNKNLEKDPLVYGLLPRFFYIFLIVLGAGFLFFLLLLIKLMGGGSGGNFLLFLFVWIGVLVVMYKQFREKSKKDKYQFKKNRKVMSNRDLFEKL